MVLESECACKASSLWQRSLSQLCCLLFVLISISIPARGVESKLLRLSEYQKQDWQVETGLPENNVRMITQMPGGLLLLATSSGLSTFDGARFEEFKIAGTTEAEAVNAVLIDRQGDLWIGTDGRGVLRSHDGKLENISEAAGRWNERIRMMYEDSNGVLWFATQNGIERYLQGRLEAFSEAGMLSGDITTPFAEDGRGLFFITEHGLWFLPKTSRKPIPYPLKTQNAGKAVAVHRAKDGTIWVGTMNGLVQLQPSNPKGEYREKFYGKISSPVTVLLSDSLGSVWIGTRHSGVWRAANGSLESWTQKNGLPDNAIRSLFLDKEENLWIGMLTGGLSRWRKAAFAPYGEAEGFVDSYAASVFSDSHGDLWLGTWGKGLFRFHEGHLQPLTPKTMPLTTPIRAIAEDRSGTIWVGTWFDGVYSFDGTSYHHHKLGVESPGNAVSALCTSPKGGLWIGTYMGVLFFPHGDPDREPAKKFLDSKLVTNLLEMPDGSMLVGTSTGLYRIQGGSVTAISDLPHPYVLSLFRDSDGYVWIGTKSGGLAYLSQDHAISLPISAGFPKYHVNTGVEDLDGHIWFGTSRGVLRASKDDLHRLIKGESFQLPIRNFDRSEGMRSSECSGPSLPSSTRTKDGVLWFATMKGFVHTTEGAEHIAQGPTYPPLVRWSREEDGDLTDVRSGSTISLNAGRNGLLLHLSALNLSNPWQMEFRYRLLGYESEWTTSHSRVVRYRRLPPGKYTFQVQVRNGGEEWSGNTQEIAVLQRGYFYQSWYFYLTLAMGALLLGFQIFRWRVRLAKGKIGVVLEERSRIARECHDSLMAGFAAVSWQLEATSKMVEEKHEKDSPLTQSVHLARNMVSHCQAEARRIIWDLRDTDEITTILSHALSRTLTAKHSSDGIEITFDVEGVEIPFAPAYIHHLVSITQEAVSNAARHAEPSLIAVRLIYEEYALKMVIRDDGKGFNPAASKTGHFGIPVMEERARTLGGSFHIQSIRNEGTEVCVTVPFNMIKLASPARQPNLVSWIGI